MSEERDTHYARTANMLWSEIIEKLASLGQCIDECNGFESGHPEDRHYMHSDDLARIMETLIAQRAYDLVAHVFNRQGEVQWERLTTATEAAAYIPDMDKWPE